jgi:hypothetical protein
MDSNTKLERLSRKRDFYTNAPDWVKTFWPTQASFDWYLKSRNKPLTEQGALQRLGRDYFVDAERLALAVENELGVTA